MATCICWKHGTVTAWGCRECLKEDFDKIIEKAIEDTRQAIREAFRDAPKSGAKFKP